MSTRAVIVLRDYSQHELRFYKHGDGGPSDTLPTLEKFLDWVETRRIRSNLQQAAGWLVILGNTELGGFREPNPDDKFMGWKASIFEPMPDYDSGDDARFQYIIDLEKKTIEVKGE